MTTHQCPACGSQLPSDAPQGECPQCLLKAGFESEPAVTSDTSGLRLDARQPIAVGAAGVMPPFAATRSYGSHGHFQPPTVAELQARIPQYEILELVGQGGMG